MLETLSVVLPSSIWSEISTKSGLTLQTPGTQRLFRNVSFSAHRSKVKSIELEPEDDRSNCLIERLEAYRREELQYIWDTDQPSSPVRLCPEGCRVDRRSQQSSVYSYSSEGCERWWQRNGSSALETSGWGSLSRERISETQVPTKYETSLEMNNTRFQQKLLHLW